MKAWPWGLLLVIFACWVGPWLSPVSSDSQDLAALLQNPSAQYWLGTDSLGRDLWLRALEGGRVSLSIGIASAVLIGVLGASVGLVAGLRSGWLDRLLMGLTDAVLMFPSILLASLVTFILGRGSWALVFAVSLTAWAPVARTVRVQVRSLMSQDFVQGARAVGASSARVLLRHLLPQVVSNVLLLALFQVPQAILTESLMSFLGLGLQPPQASWGTLAAEASRALSTYPHLMLGPGLGLTLMMVSLWNWERRLTRR